MKYSDDKLLYRKWRNKMINASKEGIPFDLTFEQFFILKENAGLKTEDLGFSGKGYVLARYNDEGGYTFGNCRFITQSENAKEKKISKKNREASRRNIAKVNSNRTGKEISEQLKRSVKFQSYVHKRQKEAIRKIMLKRSKMHKSYMGNKNSQYGKHWFTNGKENISAFECPEGFYRGRIIK